MSKFIKIPLVLAAITFASSAVLMLSEAMTHEKIALQKKLMVLNSLEQLVPHDLHDNDLLESAITINEPEFLGHRQAQKMYVGKSQGKITVIAVPVTTRKGYSGDIDLMVGIKSNGEITAIKIIEQHETPGLGDLIEPHKSDWIQQFPNQSLVKTQLKNWKVKRDGGEFDQITGATISPRAVVDAIKQALVFHKNYIQENLK